MSSHLGRALMRRPQAVRLCARNASTTSEAVNAASSGASKAKDAAGGAASKASEGLSRVTSSGGAAMNKAGAALGSAADALGRVGGRTGRLIGFVQSLIPPTVYYGKVGLELGKLIVRGRKMNPPDMATFQSYFQPVINTAKNPSALLNATPSPSAASPESILSRIRNVDQQQLTSAGIVAAEVIGFFTLGEMIGRMKIVGYRTSGHAHGGEHH
ncbi:ATP synthase subunit g, mitochondrial [Elsinoe australis]|uniref:ATP synthase subunit g, mitochondrial n=1 Tax=Elsinoe australis TaxID=40998 RepID=A0A2P7ZUG9_9PEZI|nr:ATP synthase subunit g, mitochondrial [Elsinoe australis]